ncbi:Bgt-5462 [Blumeria graminis f. sp. tritici]|uniref:Bgt-5462 n=1 Tax=Blumeria graminis f. sp. tritici TaxID=62690 RepID=A0A9X9MMK3_BLUGR|nr:Bgt-5462 [Blumeria graminis f. sp. tritici]
MGRSLIQEARAWNGVQIIAIRRIISR